MSDGSVQVRQIDVDYRLKPNKLVRGVREDWVGWYDPTAETADFVVLAPGDDSYPGFTDRAAVIATFGLAGRDVPFRPVYDPGLAGRQPAGRARAAAGLARRAEASPAEAVTSLTISAPSIGVDGRCKRLQRASMSLIRSGSCIMAVMRLSARADYALRAAIELAAAQDGHVTAEQLAQAQNIPGKFLETILTHLRRSNIVRSQRGPDGGFWLARPANEISLADIIRAIDGQLLGVRGERPENVTLPGRGRAAAAGVDRAARERAGGPGDCDA